MGKPASKNRLDYITKQPNEFGLEPLEEAVLISLGHLEPRQFSDLEIAEIFGMSRQGINLIVHRVLDKLKPKMREWV